MMRLLIVLLSFVSCIAMDRTVSVDIRPDEGAPEVFKYARNGELVYLKKECASLLPLINSQDSKGYSPLHYACFSGSVETAEYLITSGSQVNVANTLGDAFYDERRRIWKNRILTPLHAAVFVKNIDIVKLLIDNQANINSTFDENENTPLHIAAWFNFKKGAQCLLENGAKMDVRNNCGSTPVHSAAWRDSVDALKVLLKHNASIIDANATGKGNTPLYLASKAGSLQCLRLLLQQEEAKRIINLGGGAEGWTPTQIALANGHVECYIELLLAGADSFVECSSYCAHIPQLYELAKAIEQRGFEVVKGQNQRSSMMSSRCDGCNREYENNNFLVITHKNGMEYLSYHYGCFSRMCFEQYKSAMQDKDTVSDELLYALLFHGKEDFFSCQKLFDGYHFYFWKKRN